MEHVVKGKKKIGEAVEEEGSEKRTGENLGKKVDPVSSVLKVKNGDNMKIDPEDFPRHFDLNGGYREDYTGKPGNVQM